MVTAPCGRLSCRRGTARISPAVHSDLAAVVLLPAFSSALGAGDFDYGAYAESSIAVAGSNLGIAPGVAWWLDAAHSKFHTVAAYTGKIRPVGAETRELISRWANAMRHAPGTSEMFASEIEVEQEGRRYWLPIQSQLVAPLQREVRAGENAHLYLLLVGAYKQAPVLVVNEFDLAEG